MRKTAKKLTPILMGTLVLFLALLPLSLFVPVSHAAGEDGTRDIFTATLTSFYGVTQTLSAASGDGQRFYNNGETFVVISNTTGSAITATFITPATNNGLPIDDAVVVVANGVSKIIGPFPTGLFNQTTTGVKNYTFIDYSAAVTSTVANSVGVAAFKLR